MPTIVEIPNIGEVEFPDGMTDADISAAAHKLSNPQPWYSGAGAFMDAYRQNAEIAKANPNSLTGQVMRRNEAADKPMIPLPRAPQAESTIGQVASGIYNGVIAPAVETMTSPNAIRTLPVAAAGRLASAVLAPVMGANAVQQGAEAINQAGNPDATLQQVVEPAAGAVSSALMAAGSGRHAISKPQLPQNNVTTGKNTTPKEDLVESNPEIQNANNATGEPIQTVPGVPNLQGERGSGSAGLPSPEPSGKEIQPEFQKRPSGEITFTGGNEEMRNPVRELPQETPRGEAQAPQEPTPRTINTVGEGQLFRNDEISFNLASETDASAAEAAAAAEIKAQEAAKAAQDAAQTKMFEEPDSPPLESSAGEQIPQGASAAIETPAASPIAEPEAAAKPAGNALLDALNADMQTAREAGDKDKVRTLAALKVNYLLRKPPAIKKVEKSYGEQAAQPTLPAGKVKGDKPMTKTQLFSEQAVAKWVIENGGIMSATEARRVKGKDWWESTGKGMYEALGRIPPAYGKIIFRRGSKSTPDELMGAVGLRNADNQIEGSPFGPNDTHHELLARLMDEVESAKGGKSARGVTGGIKSHEQHMNEQAAIHEQQAEINGLHLPVDEMAPGDTLRLPSSSGGGVAKVVEIDADGNVTIEMPKGVTITMPSGNSLKVAEHVRSEERAAGADEPF
jgi:hypothetical protein